MMQRLVFFSIFWLAMATSLPSWAQGHDDWNWCENKKQLKEKWIVAQDAVDAKMFRDAYAPINYLIGHCPELSENLYKQSHKVYNGLIRKHPKDPNRDTWEDSAMISYELRLKHVPDVDSGKVLNLKGLYATPYLFDRKKKDIYKDLYDLYQTIHRLNGPDTYPNNYLNWMKNMYILSKYKELEDNIIMQNYEAINKAYEEGKEKSDYYKKQWKKVKPQVDELLAKTVTIDCDYISKYEVPKYKENPDDFGQTKELFAMMQSKGCKDHPLYMELLKKVAEKEPNASSYKALAEMEIEKENHNSALNYLDKAIDIISDACEKAKLHYRKAELYRNLGQKSNARNSAKAAANTNSCVATKAYAMIGDLYMYAHEECAKGENPVKDRLIYIAAHKYYQKAGLEKKAAEAKKQFPSKTEMFQRNLKEGSTMNTGCWINETVTLKRRP